MGKLKTVNVRVSAHVRNCVWDLVRTHACIRILERAENRVRARMWDRIRERVWDRIRNRMWNVIKNA